MSDVISGVRVLSFEEWKKLPAVVELAAELGNEECDECDGSGRHTCECGDEHDCGYCRGTGKDADAEDMLRKTYRDALKSEMAKLVLWRDGLPIPGERRKES